MNASQLESLKLHFSSEYFTPQMLLYNLSKYRDRPEILDLLYQTMLRIPDKEIQLYSPQLCQLLIKTEIPQLIQFFLEKCSQSTSMFYNVTICLTQALLATWCIFIARKTKQKKAEDGTFSQSKVYLIQQMEMSMVNGQFNEEQLNGLDQKEVETILLQNYEGKNLRQEHFTEMQKFMGTLIRHSLVLKEFPKDDRKHHLKLFIQKENQNLQRIIKKFSQGLTLPFLDDDEKYQDSYSIVSILEKHQICFHTKKRVPYLILVETINPKDLKQYNFIPIQSMPNIEVEGYVEAQLNDQGFEKQMAQIEQDEQKLYHEALEKIMKMEKKGKKQSQIMQTIDSFVQKQKKQTQDKEVQNSDHAESTENNKRKLSLKTEDNSIINKSKRYRSAERNDEKSEQFIQNLSKILPLNKLHLLRKFKKKQKNLWEQTWEEKIAHYKQESRYSHFPSYKIRPIIIKGGDDLRQEMFAIQMMKLFNQIFQKEDLNLYLRPYHIIVTSANSGIVEYIPNTMSIDALKKRFGNGTKTLFQIYQEVFGGSFEEAQKNFIESLASYSLFTYLMQVKDRHNGNILIDDRGHIIHIDFGFLLQTSPGGVNFESAPFKLTQEYLELLKGRESDYFGYFKTLMVKGFLFLKKYVLEFENFLKIMVEKSDLPCFQNIDLKVFVSRFQLGCTDKEIMEYVEKLINQSLGSWRTAQYDNFQKRTNGILP